MHDVMQIGRTVRLRIPLDRRHTGIRFDRSQAVIETPIAPEGASGEIRQVSRDGTEALVELTWDVSRYCPFTYKNWRIWVRRAFMGLLFE